MEADIETSDAKLLDLCKAIQGNAVNREPVHHKDDTEIDKLLHTLTHTTYPTI